MPTTMPTSNQMSLASHFCRDVMNLPTSTLIRMVLRRLSKTRFGRQCREIDPCQVSIESNSRDTTLTENIDTVVLAEPQPRCDSA